jgi:23S rRNA (cytidine1920-2'-O)/16S rRNA (cytidine1409-2'-O)-methyltransferase
VAAKSRLDSELVRRGLARSREHAHELVDSGRVRIAGLVATKHATGVEAGASLSVQTGDGPDYV